MSGECSSRFLIWWLTRHFWNRSAKDFSIAFRPQTGPVSVTRTASSVKNAAIAAASLLLHASSNLLLFAPNCWPSCGSDVLVCSVFIWGGVEISHRRLTPTVGISHVASNVRVAGGKENAFGQRSPSNMQIARLVLFGVNIKNEALHQPANAKHGRHRRHR